MTVHVLVPARRVNARRRPYRSSRAHFRKDRCAAAVRAFTAAELYLTGKVPTLADAALGCGSNVAYIIAAITLVRSEDAALRERVLRGAVPLLAAARQAQQMAKLIAAFRNASAGDRVAFARAVGPTVLFDTVLVPAT
jgi:hypothetical protein